jgi:hypothetical protein
MATARAHTSRRDVSPMVRAHASNGSRCDGSRLDLSCASHGQIWAVRFSKY